MIVDILFVVLLGILLFRNEKTIKVVNASLVKGSIPVIIPPPEIIRVENVVERLVEVEVEREGVAREPSRVIRRREFDKDKPFEVVTSSESLVFETIKEAKAARVELVAKGEKTVLYTWGRWRGVE